MLLIKKIFLSLIIFVASLEYVWYQNITIPTSPMLTTSEKVVQTKKVVTTPAVFTMAPTKHTTVTAPRKRGRYKNGTYTGIAADAYYGNVQVKVKVRGGKLTSVIFLQQSGNDSTSRYINGIAMPQLKQEAIQIQSAKVSGVSGASYTSAAFRKSLANALKQANNI